MSASGSAWTLHLSNPHRCGAQRCEGPTSQNPSTRVQTPVTFVSTCCATDRVSELLQCALSAKMRCRDAQRSTHSAALLCTTCYLLMTSSAAAHRDLKQAAASPASASAGSFITDDLLNVLSNNQTVGKLTVTWRHARTRCDHIHCTPSLSDLQVQWCTKQQKLPFTHHWRMLMTPAHYLQVQMLYWPLAQVN